MIRIERQGAAWTVVRDGRLVHEGAGAGVHKTRASAEAQARRLARKLDDDLHLPPGEVTEPRE